jgi:excisionase family DNA binding protein
MKLWTIKEIIDVTGLSRSTVKRAIKSGKLESRLVEGTRQRRIMHAWLVKWLAGMDPLQGSVITIEEVIKKKDTITHKRTRIEPHLQPSLFDQKRD